MAKEAIPFDMNATGVVDLQAAAATKVGGGRYSLRRVLGRGGMGIVWLAYDERLQREVALKFLPAQIRYDAAALEDLRRETARSQCLSHPHIIRIHDLYESAGEDPFISMEFVDGSNLANIRVQQTGRVLTWTFLEPLVRQLCDALEYAHTQGIVHRDLKPANLMVDQAGNLKLADFGIARAVTDTISRCSIVQTSGTLLYMSPQQMEGGLPKRTDDIYGMGACLYELLTSKPPFHSGDLLHQLRNQTPRPLKERLYDFGLKNDIPDYVNELVLACLHKDERHRLRTAREVVRWLDARGNPDKLRQPSRLKESLALLPQWLGRWKWWITSGATALFLVGMASWFLKPASTVAARRPSAAPAPLNTQGLVFAKTQPTNQSTTRRARSDIPPVTPLPSRTTTAPRGGTPVRSGLGSAPATPSQTAPPTALELVVRANAHVPESSKNKLLKAISARTAKGLPPARWRLVFYDSSAHSDVVELRFESGQMARLHEPTRIFDVFNPRKPLDLDRVKLDSDQAARLALDLPTVAQLPVTALELELERGPSGGPVWQVRLFGGRSEERPLGSVVLAAEDGKVLKDIQSR